MATQPGPGGASSNRLKAKTPAKTAKPKSRKAAAPTSKSLDYGSLLSVARKSAKQDITLQLNAIRAEQARAIQRAKDQAALINQAGVASGNFVSGLGDKTIGNYTDAAQNVLGAAQGYSGELRNTAQDEAAKVLSGLQAAGSQQTPDMSQGASLANLLYGLGGDQPAQNLQQVGLATADAQNQLPGQLRGYAQQAAIGALGVGQQNANDLNPEIRKVLAGGPKLAQDYFDSISGFAQKERAAASLEAYRSGTLGLRAAGLAETARSHDLTAESAANRLEESSAYHEILAGLSAGRLDLATATARTSALYKEISSQQAQERINQSRIDSASLRNSRLRDDYRQDAALQNQIDAKNGYRTDPTTGKRTTLPGFKRKADGSYIKVSLRSAAKKPGGMTQSQWSYAYGKIDDMIDEFYNGIPELKDARGQVTQQGQDYTPYPRAFMLIKARYPTMPNSKIVEMLNNYYQPGEGGRPELGYAPHLRAYGGK